MTFQITQVLGPNIGVHRRLYLVFETGTMAKLWQVAKLIRSKNSGPFELTFDVIFKDRATYEKVRDAKVINAQWFARTYRLTPEVVSVIEYDAANAIKVTIPRPVISGDVDDTDVFGGQQYGPLVDLDVP